MSYNINFYEKFSEEDVYSEGCKADTGRCYGLKISFEGDNLTSLMCDVCTYFGVEMSDLVLNSCEDEGRIDVMILENDDGYPPSELERREWVQGRCRLWHSVYTGRLTRSETMSFPRDGIFVDVENHL